MARRRKVSSKPTAIADASKEKPTTRHKSHKTNGLPEDNPNGSMSILEADESQEEEDLATSTETNSLDYSQSANSMKEACESPSTTVVHKKFGKINCLLPEGSDSGTETEDPVLQLVSADGSPSPIHDEEGFSHQQEQDMLSNAEEDTSSQDEQVMLQNDDEGSSPQEEELMLQNDDEGSSTHDEQVMVQMVLGEEQEQSEGGDEDTETFVVEVEEGIMGEISQEDTVIVEVVGDDLMYSEEVGGTIWQVQSVEESENGYVYQDSEDVLCEVETCEEETCEDESESREDLVEESGDPPAIDNGEEMSTDVVSSSISINKQNETDIEVSTSCVNHVQLSIDSDISDREVEEGSSAIQNKLSPDEITQMVLGLNCGSVDVNIEHQLCEAPEVSPKNSDLKNCESGSSSRDSCVETSTRQRNGATHVYDRAKKVKSPKSNKSESAVIPRNSVQSTPPRKNVICLDESPLKTPSNLGNKQLDSTEFDLPISSIGGSVLNADLNSLNDRDNSDKRVDKQRVVETGTSQSKKVKVIEKSNESEPENKKVSSFRNRSGSSDTTGSESGSRSPVVRRSTRIRVPTTSKSQSDDKGVVDSSDSSSENPPASSVSVAAHSSANSVLISDTSMPVKVKSRWRRSSELEMGGIKGSDGDTGSLTQPMSPQSDPVSQPSSPPPPHPPMPPPSSVISDQERMERREQELREIAERLKGYENLNENLYLTERTRSKEVKRMICDCPSVTKDEAARGEMGCGEDCLNKLLMIECGSRCVAKDRCSNKKFQNADYARCEIFKTDRKGFGLRAMEDLPGGTFIMEYVGEVLDPKEFRKRAKEYSKDQNQHYYFMALKSDAIIDATNKGNNSRFINHSCDPNAETQKWTVNGELRIGFFTTKAVAAGEEITFDYQFQRYGKEAQRCYCESSLCRGWIGGDPNKEKSRTQWQEWKDKDSSTKKKRDKDKEKDKDKRREDIDLEEEIEKLCTTGLKSRAHTLTLCRLMVRAEDIHSRTQMLRLLQDGEPACCRLFLDYHGLKLMWSWMIDTKTAENIKIKTEILRTLKKLPIPNKTMLIDSKVLTVVDRWSEFKAKVTASPPDNDRTPEEESSNDQSEKMEVEDQKIPLLENRENIALPNHENGEKLALPDTPSSTDVKMNASEIRPSDSSTSPEQDGSVRIKEEEKDDPDAEVKTCAELAALLLQEWSTLKEVFRIPKKERIEQMKEHEREADEHYRDGDRYDRYDRRKKRSRESPDHERSRRPRLEDRDRDRRDDRRYEDRRHEDRTRYGYGERSRYEERDRDRPRHEDREDRERNVDVRLSKEARRKAFALKVQQEEEQREARRVQAEKDAEVQKEWWRFHAERYLDPHVTAAILQTQFVDPITNQWLQYPLTSDPASFSADIAAAARLFPTDPSNPVPVPVPVPVPSHLPVTSFPGVFPVVAPGQFDPSPVVQPVLQPQASAVITVVDPSAEQSVEEAPQVAFSVSEDPFAVKDPSLQGFPVSGLGAESQQAPVQYLPVPMPIKLPPKWKSAKDAEGRVYYYHVKTRISQWEPPPWPQVAPKAVDSESSSSSTDEDDDDDDSESTEEEEKTPKGLKESVKPRREKAFPCLVVQEEEEEEEEEDDEADMPLVVEQGLGMAAHHQQHMRADPDYPNFSPRPTVAEERRKRRAGLVQEHIISPRREEDRTDPKIYKEIKEKLRRQKEKRRQRDREGKSSKRRHRDSDKSRTIHSLEKPVTVAADTSSDAARRIKDQFRLNMAGVIVTHLNPYRKPDCRMGRITNTEDFKHLARKLTHFVMLKELKHCRNVDDLECNDNVKHKARDFIKKYMAKFGDVYQRPKDDD